MTRIDLVLFDLDDTLLDHTAASRVGLAQHLEAIGHASGDDEFARWKSLEEQHYLRYLDGEVSHQEQRRARTRAFVEPLGIPLARDEEADAWFDGYIAGARAAWRVFDDVTPCLAALGDRAIGIITNGEEDAQRAKLIALGLDDIDPVVCSGTVGVAKPEARIFRIACEAAGVAPRHACYVGDRLGTDAIGAARAGLTGVWIDRAGRATAAELAEAADEGVVVIRSLADLPAALGE